MIPDLVHGPWNLRDLKIGKLGEPSHGLKVFSCFHCGGGSTMGYKLAGFEVLGGVEIDPKMMEIYNKNHRPKHSFLMGVQQFKHITESEIPKDLFNLDILDGSPPCSSFSMAGSREDAWGKEKKFREGQADQVLDDLFFHFIDISKKLKPKMVIAENVKGLIMGKARGYVKEIFKSFDKSGYQVQLFLLNSSRMGVPQSRERTFFIASRKDLKLPKLELNFNEDIVPVSKAIEGAGGSREPLSESFSKWWKKTPPGKSFSYAHPKGSYFNSHKLHPLLPANTTIATSGAVQSLWNEPSKLSPEEYVRIQTFPDDYDFIYADAKYVCGMSVPPFMMQRISRECAKLLLGYGKT